jgi:Fe-S-cluster-containing dehydrogenase component
MTRYAYFVDLSLCAGCESCTVACQAVNGLDWDMRFTKVERVLTGTFPDVKSSFITTQCLHCDEPPCAAVCPTGATYKTPEGPVKVEYDQCIGCQYCMTACPYGARSFDEASHLVKKCTLCYDRMAQGDRPACEQTCLTGARLVGDLDDPKDPIHAKISAPDVIHIDGTSFYYHLPEAISREVLPADFKGAGVTWAWQSILQPVGQVMMGGTLAAVLVSLAVNAAKGQRKEGAEHGDH